MRIALWMGVVVLSAAHGACAPCDETIQLGNYDRVRYLDVSIASYAGAAYVMWSVSSLIDGGERGVFITRVGSRTVRLSDSPALVSLGRTDAGLLACRESGDETRCALLDWRLETLRRERVVDLPGLEEVVELGGQLHAQVSGRGPFPNYRLVPIEPDGTPTGEPAFQPCFSFRPIPVASDQAACLDDNSTESGECQAADGTAATCEVRALLRSPQGGSRSVVLGEGSAPLGVARGDDILVLWQGCDGTCTRVIRGDGSLGPTYSVPEPAFGAYATDGGYVVVWPADIDSFEPVGAPQARRLDHEGAPTGEAEALGPPEGVYGWHGATATDGGFTAVWTFRAGLSNFEGIHARRVCED